MSLFRNLKKRLLEIHLDLSQPGARHPSIIKAGGTCIRDSGRVDIQGVDDIVLYLEEWMRIPVQGKPDQIHLPSPDDPAVQAHKVITESKFPGAPARPVQLKILPRSYPVLTTPFLKT